MSTEAPRSRSIAAIAVVSIITLVSIGVSLLAVYLEVLAFLFNDGAARPVPLIATILVLAIAVGIAYGGHALAERIAPKTTGRNV